VRRFFLILLLVCSLISNLIAVDTIYVFSDIIISGNTRTKSEVIFRELPFAVGDIIFQSQIHDIVAKAEQNLLKTSLFNFATVEFSLKENKIFIEIKVEERWYLWPYPILEHGTRNWSTFLRDKDWSRINYGAAFEFHNLAGLNRTLKIKVRAGYREHFLASYILKGIGHNRNFSVGVLAELFRQKSFISAIDQNTALYFHGRSKNVFTNFNTSLVFSNRIKIASTLGAGLNFKSYSLIDTVAFPQEEDVYNFFSTSFVNPFVYFKSDTRNNKVYPVNGVYFGLVAGYWQNLTDNSLSFLGINSHFDFHYRLPVKRLSAHFCTSYRLLYETGSHSPFFQSRLEFGKDFWTRGYEYYYFLGRNSLKLQNTFSFMLSDFKIHRLPKFLPDEFNKSYSRLYLDVFVDLIYTDAFANDLYFHDSMSGEIRESYGVGISLETYYDRLLQIYVAYAPYFNKTGIFVNYQTPIIKLY
jgi:outer membrane protein assembly factor BamA